jgi:hypothetical protein
MQGMPTKKRKSRPSRRSSRKAKPRHGNVRATYDVVEIAPGRSTDGRTLYVGQSASRARAVFEDFLDGGAMLLKNGRIIDERGPHESENEERYPMGYMQGRGAS